MAEAADPPPEIDELMLPLDEISRSPEFQSAQFSDMEMVFPL
ncbi:hypothetical protein [Thalassospira lucentensis]|nr:hypothetical protein [Thalassospira lucentensis]WOI08974.1 hypothetical protein R1T41_00675 [Thalassospira lucentensis]